MLKLIIFSIWGSGDVQPFDAYENGTFRFREFDEDTLVDVSDCEYAESFDDDDFIGDQRRYSI